MNRTVYHLGRTGHVAGGMTQVLNDYLTWQFPNFHQRVMTSRKSSALKSIVPFFRAWLEISKLSADESVVVSHLSQNGSFLREGLLAIHARRRRLPVVAQIHGSSFPHFARRRPRLAAWVLRHAHVVIVLSSESSSAVRSLPGVSDPILIPNAVGAIPASPKLPIVLFGGAITRRKGVDALLAAWGSNPPPGWQLTLAGPPVEPDLIARLPANVSFVGALERSELQRRLSEASIAVLPSTDEGMPLFILEALAASAAVISTPVGAIPRVLENGAGVLVPVGHPSALSAAVKELAADAGKRAALAEEGLRRWRKWYSSEAVIPQLESAWEKAIKRSGS